MAESTATTNNLAITKERVKAWDACSGGYRWFLEKFPEGGEFAEVHKALIADKRDDYADWLVEKAFDDFDTETRVKQTAIIAGADATAIAAQVEAGAEAATTGYRANAATTGEGANAATTGAHAVAASLGIEAKAKAGSGGAIVLAWRNDDGDLLGIKASMVGENGIKPDVWYVLDEEGNFSEEEA